MHLYSNLSFLVVHDVITKMSDVCVGNIQTNPFAMAAGKICDGRVRLSKVVRWTPSQTL